MGAEKNAKKHICNTYDSYIYGENCIIYSLMHYSKKQK